ncbi:MAG TPA: energy transducer TonB [Bryobacteraceae bacterium]|nr:energy transducer TonB [Bryobacteraceae bacterium]
MTFRLSYCLPLIAGLFAASVMGADMRVGSDDAMKAAVQKTQPIYPPIARQMHVAGRVEVEVIIAADGTVADVKVVTGNSLLTPAVVEAVKKWKFTPFTANGEPTKAVAALGFDFKI